MENLLNEDIEEEQENDDLEDILNAEIEEEQENEKVSLTFCARDEK